MNLMNTTGEEDNVFCNDVLAVDLLKMTEQEQLKAIPLGKNSKPF